VRDANNYNSAARNIIHNILGTAWCDLVFCWFGSPRFLFPVLLGKLLRKKVVIVAGGYDVVDLPEIDYGNMRKGLRSWMGKRLFKLADCMICVSKSNVQEAINNAGIPMEKLTLIYHGFEVEGRENSAKEPMVITVGRVSRENLKRKGIGSFIDVAKSFPGIPFIVIGTMDNGIVKEIGEGIPGNVTLTGYVSDERLKDYLDQAKVYVQASSHEGFGCSVAEAMLHKCIPVVSNCFALPEVVGDAGYLTKPGDLEDLKDKIGMALKSDERIGEKARLRIMSEFPLEKRRAALLKLIESL
jgi:glycosyltransferase involved in cell wall biosynthesis